MNDTDKQEVLAAVAEALRAGMEAYPDHLVPAMIYAINTLTEQAKPKPAPTVITACCCWHMSTGTDLAKDCPCKCHAPNPAPPADVTREDVEYHLANWRGADTTSAVQRAMIRRVFADVLEGK